MDSIISYERITKPTINLLMSISAALNRIDPQTLEKIRNCKKDNWTYLQQMINDHVVALVIGDITFRAGYYPQMFISVCNDMSINLDIYLLVPDYCVSAHCIGYTALRTHCDFKRVLCGYSFDEPNRHEGNLYNLALNNPTTRQFIIEWEKNPSIEGSMVFKELLGSLLKHNNAVISGGLDSK
jgi:hypothetical protein